MRRNYSDPVYKAFRTEVLKRDNFRCQMPSCYNSRNLHVHHIQPWAIASSLRYEKDNGITLCKQCHKSVEGKELHFVQTFREIIDGKIQKSS